MFSWIREHHDDELARALRYAGHLQRGPRGRRPSRSRWAALFLSQLPGDAERVRGGRTRRGPGNPLS